jgi:ubiquinone/menaquinone biosynthesis C-methylase UbiE
VIVNTWHHIDDQTKYLALMKRMLKPGGQVVHVDFHERQLPVGPRSPCRSLARTS